MSKTDTRKVVPLRLAPPPAKQGGAPTIEILEKLLHMAKCGELEGIIFVAMKKGDHNSYGWAGKAGSNSLETLGALERLKDELLAYAKQRGL
ncbi:hypothetical protein [Nitrosococcus wardiae]|uniref:Uncharacterized protein n=1 Tax=Nitrosococcus wardiae TaxID=1814290 RepID=A0A4V1AW65_9GAMM|nr:hypothetical protein [Nitrosococcus wardiae]QBQ55555.1 hypothetical protein E3U44_14340 [Nitrosococcus wardiae]